MFFKGFWIIAGLTSLANAAPVFLRDAACQNNLVGAPVLTFRERAHAAEVGYRQTARPFWSEETPNFAVITFVEGRYYEVTLREILLPQGKAAKKRVLGFPSHDVRVYGRAAKVQLNENGTQKVTLDEIMRLGPPPEPGSMLFNEFDTGEKNPGKHQLLPLTMHREVLQSGHIYTFTDLGRRGFAAGKLLGWDIENRGNPILMAEDGKIYELNGHTIDWLAIRTGRTVPEWHDSNPQTVFAINFYHSPKVTLFAHVEGFAADGSVLFSVVKLPNQSPEDVANLHQALSPFPRVPEWVPGRFREIYAILPQNVALYRETRTQEVENSHYLKRNVVSQSGPWRQISIIPAK